MMKSKPTTKAAPAKPAVATKAAPTKAAPTKAAPAAKAASDNVKVGKSTITVQRTVIDGETKEAIVSKDESSTIEVNKFETAVASVSVGGKIKRSDNNYGSSEVSVIVTSPCYVEEIDDVAAQLSRKVEELLSKEAEEAGFSADAVEGEPEDVDVDTTEGEPEEGAEGETEETEGQAITPEEILNMKREDLVEIIELNELPIDHKKIKSTDTLKKQVIEILNGSEETEEPEEIEETETEEPEEGTEDADADESSGYTKKELDGKTLAEVKEIITAWELQVKLSKEASPAAKKAAYIAAILEAQGA